MAHQHTHHQHNTPTFNSAFAIAVILNLGFTLIEALYAVTANSMSLLADAGHNLGDVVGLALAWGASVLVTRGASAKYSYGFKRTTILAAIVNALILVGTSTVIAYESIYKLLNPVTVHELTVIIVAFLGILINGGTAMLFMRGQATDLNIKGAFLHLAYDALISFGVVLTGFAILYTQWHWLDPAVGLIIVVAILAGTWGLLRDSVNLILDAVPHTVEEKAVRRYLCQLPDVAGVHDLHIWGLSTNEIALTAHLIMPDKPLGDEEYQKINYELKEKFNINHVTLQIEKGTSEDPCGRANVCC